MSMAFLSGATGGLGRSMAVECASRGWDLFLTDRNAAVLEAFANSLRHAWQVRMDCFPCDMADDASREALLEAMYARGVRLHFICNIAGVDFEGAFLEKPRRQLLDILKVNDISTVDMLHGLLGLRDSARPLRIVNVCSLAAMFPMPVKATYAASKRLLLDLSLALREEWRDSGVTVTALCPAGMATNEECIRGMAVQGIMGRLTTLQIGRICAGTVDAALRGRAIYIPGVINRALAAAGAVMPRSIVARLIGWRWRRTHHASEQLKMV